MKRPTEVGGQLFQECLKEKKTTEPKEKALLEQSLKTFWGTVSSHCCLIFSLRLSMYKKQKTTNEFGFSWYPELFTLPLIQV